jgi:hypothetical protein
MLTISVVILASEPTKPGFRVLCTMTTMLDMTSFLHDEKPTHVFPLYLCADTPQRQREKAFFERFQAFLAFYCASLFLTLYYRCLVGCAYGCAYMPSSDGTKPCERERG